MSEQDSNLDIDIEATRSLFVTANELTTMIADQNGRFQEAPTVFADDPEILDLVMRGIVEEQQGTFLELEELNEDSGKFYAALGTLGVSIETQSNNMQTELEDLQQEQQDKAREVREIAERLQSEEEQKLATILENVRRLSPKALSSTQALLAERTKNAVTSNAEISEIESYLIEVVAEIERQQQAASVLASQQSTVDELFAEGGKPWPLPAAVMSAEQLTTSQSVILDEMPVEPRISPAGHERLKRMRSHGWHQDASYASMYAAFYLTEHEGETVTVEEIANFLYDDAVQARFNTSTIRTRVTSILGPKRNHVPQMLLEEGYVLQFGWRRNLEKTEGTIRISNGNGNRIYRVVPIEVHEGLQLGKYEQPGEGYVDEFTVVPIEAAQEPIPAHPDVFADDDTAEQAVPPWEKNFKFEIGQALDKLESSGLLKENKPLALKVIRRLYPNHARLTETGLNKMIRADHLQVLNNMSAVEWSNKELRPSEMVIIELFHEKRGPLRKDSREKSRALAIIEDSVAAFFQKKEAEARQKANQS